MEKLKASDFNGSMDSKVQLAAFLEQDISLEQIESGIQKELRDAYSLLSEILANRDLRMLIAQYYFDKFTRLKESEKNAPKLEFEKP